MKSSRFYIFLLILFFCFYTLPYAFLLKHWNSWDSSANYGLIYGLSSLQALVSVLGTLVLGFIGVAGLLWARAQLETTTYSGVEYLALMPSVLPSLFVIIAVLGSVKNYPLGFYGVVILHIISMSGFCSVLLLRLLDDKLGVYSPTARALGASGVFFIRKMWPLIYRDVFLVCGVFFFYFLTSISVPLIIGGTGFTSIEKVIFDQITVSQNWSGAIQYFLIQALVLIPIFVWTQSYTSRVATSNAVMTLGASFWGLLLILAPAFLVISGLFLRFLPGAKALAVFPEFHQNLHLVIVGSLLLGFSTGALTMLMLFAWSFLSLQRSGLKLLRGLCVPSVSILSLGYAFFTLQGVGSFFNAAFALSLIFVPLLYRLGIYPQITRLQIQIESAVQLGAGVGFIFKRIIFPQIAHQVFVLSGLSAVWSMSDFTISRIILEKDWSLGLWMQSLVNQYRWDVAVAGCWLLILCGFIVFFFFWSVSRVCRREFM